MTRPLVVGNGELHVGINKFGQVGDFYYPHVGLENHTAGDSLRHHVGVWVDGRISWLDIHANEWDVTFSYPHEALIGRTIAINKTLGVRLEFDDAVDSKHPIFMRNIHVVNTHDSAREVRLFMHQAFTISDARSHNDTAQYLPDEAVLHYRGNRAFVVGGLCNDAPFDQHSIGLFGSNNHEGTFRDAEDGVLSMNDVAYGKVDSTLRFSMQLPAHDSGRVHYWIAAGTSQKDAVRLHTSVKKKGISSRLHATRDWWQKWLQPSTKAAEKLSPDARASFIKSVLLIKSHIDKHGAIIASTDSSLRHSKDTYAYCWPRDAAYALWPLIRLGYTEEPQLFFEFCKSAMHPDGYLLHKYQADGAAGPSWHPYAKDDTGLPPIQQDETALVVFMFLQYYQTHPSSLLLETFYESMVYPMASFLAEHVDSSTGLPKPSYDLWGERFTTSTYTTAVVYAALLAAADLAEAAEDADSAVAWRSAADDMFAAAHKHLYSSSKKIFYRGVEIKDGTITSRDETVDSSSVFGAFMYGLFPAYSTELKNAMKTLHTTFSVDPARPRLPRYENDTYCKHSSSRQSNWWIICTLWLAQYYVEENQMDKAEATLAWVRSSMLDAGVLSEQVDATSGKATSAAPLIWSHAEYIGTLLDTITEAPKE